MRLVFFSGCAAALLLVVGNADAQHNLSLPPPARAVATTAPYCIGDYADDFSALSARAREFERKVDSQYSYCLRTSAVYECLSYGADGNVRRVRKKTVAHGTGFAYRQLGGDVLLLTNEHVADWPAVTDDDHPVDGVPNGCKRISDSVKIVDNEADDYDRDDIPLTRVVADPQLDVAILKAHAKLRIMPWKIGHSAALRERNVVEVRGFPLGAFEATNLGKVVSAYDHDDYKDWDHNDFVIDALLSAGNSGSPVLAVSCRTGELELVGIYHAGYDHGSALNVVVAIDQLRDLMTTLKRSPHSLRGQTPVALGLPERVKLVSSSRAVDEPFFPFGGLTSAVRWRSDGALLFEIFSHDFPMQPHPVAVIEDLPPLADGGGFGELGRVWFGNPRGLKGYTRADLEGDAQAQLARVLDGLRHDALAAFAYRAATHDGDDSRAQYQRQQKLQRRLQRDNDSQSDLAQAVLDLADRLSPHDTESGSSLADAFMPPAPPAAPRPTGVAVIGSPLPAAETR